MSTVAFAIENLNKSVGMHFQKRVTNLLDAQREALSAPLTNAEMYRCYCPGECEMDADKDEVCPIVARIYADMLPRLLKRIGAAVTP